MIMEDFTETTNTVRIYLVVGAEGSQNNHPIAYGHNSDCNPHTFTMIETFSISKYYYK